LTKASAMPDLLKKHFAHIYASHFSML